MSWKQQVSVVVLVLFTALPVSATLCAMMCGPAAAAASAHHGSDRNCEQVARASTDVLIEGASDQGCGNHAAGVRHVASVVSERVELKAGAIVFAFSARHSSFSSALAIKNAGPPGTAPRTTIPPVLRV